MMQALKDTFFITMKQENIIKIKKNKASNVYYKNNPKFFNELFEIVINHPKNFGQMIKSKDGMPQSTVDRSYLSNWINQQLPILQDKKYSISTKCYWILTGLIDFPECPVCGKQIKRNVLSIDGYGMTCSQSCGNRLAAQEKMDARKKTGKLIATDLKRSHKKEINDKIDLMISCAKSHEDFTKIIIWLTENISRPFTHIFNDIRLAPLKNEIISFTPLLNDGHFTFITRRYWYVHKIIDFPVCDCDGCSNKITKNVITFANGYVRKDTLNKYDNGNYGLYCSRECAQRSKMTQENKQKTKLQNFGDKNYNNRDKAKSTSLERYGTDDIMKTELGKNRYIQGVKKKYGEQYEWVSQVPEVKEKMKMTIKLKSEEEKQKTIDKYSSSRRSHSKESNQEIYQRSRQTYFNRTGYWSPNENPNVNMSAKKYKYDNKIFGSLPELVFYIWLKINNYDFEFQPKNSALTYTDKKGKIHRYFPDFKINKDGEIYKAGIYEIKGDNHFDKITGKMIDISNPSKNYIAEAKHQCMLSNNVHIMLSSQLRSMQKEIQKIIGRQTLLSFRVKAKNIKN